MRVHFLLIVSVVVLIFFTVSTANVSVQTARDIDVSFPRTLRTRNLGGSSEEERAGGGAISVSASEKLASLFKSSKVTDDQLQKWLSKGKSADDVFYRMKLAKPRTWIFNNPQFSKWVQYADDLSATASGKGTSAVSTLTTQFGDDELYKILSVAKRDSSSEELASKLQADQLKHWIAIGKDPDEIYKIYDLQYVGGKILQDPQFSAWTKYVDDLNAKHEGTISIIPTLRKYFSDEDLFKMAETAKTVKETESMGLKLDDAFVQFWINEKKTPAKVLAELQLEATTKTLESPLFSLLTKFTDAYNVKSPQTKTTMIETLTQAFGDEKVAKMLTAVKANDWKAKKIATELESAQLKMWLSSGKSVDDVYELLKLPYRALHYDFGGNPLFMTWIAYMNTFSTENPDKVARLLSTLATQFDDRPMMQILQAAEKFPSMERVAGTLQLHQAEKVFATGISPYKAFTMVSLDSVGDSVLSSPLFKKWMTYVDDFNKKNPGKEESWFLPLRAEYQDYRLGKIIDKAMKDPNTMKLAKLVEKERMKEWLVRWETLPSMAFRDLHLDKAGDKVFSSPNFELWVKYLDDWNQAYPSKKTTMIDGFLDNYHTLDLVSMFTAAEKVPSTKKLASQLKDALVDKWVADKKTLDYLKSWLSHVPYSDDMLERYTKKLNGV